VQTTKTIVTIVVVTIFIIIMIQEVLHVNPSSAPQQPLGSVFATFRFPFQ
jgi:hypothetical protein